MNNSKQSSWGFNNTQVINNIVVDEKYIQSVVDFPNHPKLINRLVEGLLDKAERDIESKIDMTSHPKITSKISYNRIKKYRFIIEENYSENAYFIEEAYSSLNFNEPNNKKLVLSHLRDMYLRVIGEIGKIDQTKAEILSIDGNSDHIIDRIWLQLSMSISSSNDLNSFSKEHISAGILTIIIHAFVECKILENPNKQ